MLAAALLLLFTATAADDAAVLRIAIDAIAPDERAVTLSHTSFAYDPPAGAPPPPTDRRAILGAKLALLPPRALPAFATANRSITLADGAQFRAAASGVVQPMMPVIELTMPAYSDDGEYAYLQFRVVKPFRDGGRLHRGTVMAQRIGETWSLEHLRIYSSEFTPGTDAPSKLGGDVSAPVVLRRVEPKFPGHARVPELVVAEAIIDEQGRPTYIEVLRSGSQETITAFRAAFAQWKFRPAMRGDTPVATIYNLTVRPEFR